MAFGVRAWHSCEAGRSNKSQLEDLQATRREMRLQSV